jgi:hypothetical protein
LVVGTLRYRLLSLKSRSKKALHQVDDVLARDRSFGMIGLPARFWLMRSESEVAGYKAAGHVTSERRKSTAGVPSKEHTSQSVRLLFLFCMKDHASLAFSSSVQSPLHRKMRGAGMPQDINSPSSW